MMCNFEEQQKVASIAILQKYKICILSRRDSGVIHACKNVIHGHVMIRCIIYAPCNDTITESTFSSHDKIGHMQGVQTVLRHQQAVKTSSLWWLHKVLTIKLKQYMLWS